MKYKFSMFNTYVIKSEYIIIYNSYSTNILKINKSSKLYDMVINKDICCVTEISELIEGGFIVNEEENEILKRKLHINDLVMDNKLVFTMLTTGQCNFRCKYCYEKFKDGAMSKELQESFITFIKNNIKKYSGLHLRWFGGEPLLAMDVIENISMKTKKICDDNNRTFSSEILTNAYLLEIDKFKKLISLGVNQFKITLDGPGIVHDKQRVLANGKGTFTKIMENLKNIRDNSKNLNFRIIIRTNISKDSLSALEEYLELMNKEFGKDNRFTFKFKTVDLLEGSNEEEIKKMKITNANELFFRLSNSVNKLNYGIYFEHLKTGICRAGKRNNFVLGPDGMLFKCLVYFDREENKIGSFDNKGNMIIDEAKLSLWVNNYNNTDKCLECKNSARCIGGKCVANRIFKSDVKCNFSDNHLINVIEVLNNTSGEQKIREIG